MILLAGGGRRAGIDSGSDKVGAAVSPMSKTSKRARHRGININRDNSPPPHFCFPPSRSPSSAATRVCSPSHFLTCAQAAGPFAVQTRALLPNEITYISFRPLGDEERGRERGSEKGIKGQKRSIMAKEGVRGRERNPVLMFAFHASLHNSCRVSVGGQGALCRPTRRRGLECHLQ